MLRRCPSRLTTGVASPYVSPIESSAPRRPQRARFQYASGHVARPPSGRNPAKTLRITPRTPEQVQCQAQDHRAHEDADTTADETHARSE
jgi:hypothetical protein